MTSEGATAILRSRTRTAAFVMIAVGLGSQAVGVRVPSFDSILDEARKRYSRALARHILEAAIGPDHSSVALCRERLSGLAAGERVSVNSV